MYDFVDATVDANCADTCEPSTDIEAGEKTDCCTTNTCNRPNFQLLPTTATTTTTKQLSKPNNSNCITTSTSLIFASLFIIIL